MSAEQNISAIRRLFQALNDRDMSAVSDVTTPNCIRHDLTQFWGDMRGREELVDFLQIVLKALPDLQIEIEDIFATEDRVAVHSITSGTHKGELLGVSPTGKEVKYDTINLYRFEEGKIAEAWALFNAAGLLRQIGALNL